MFCLIKRRTAADIRRFMNVNVAGMGEKDNKRNSGVGMGDGGGGFARAAHAGGASGRKIARFNVV